ncbi:UDP-N-acetylmuramoyl-tripeptide--D-alanyl-D-alanine ligase [Buchnera aphidicola]|uniref:UDP-N-acetylmuramoyl-tripeptide--D-alanyl-D-alanine ligase n=2 Tax=Buchnera aphidicola TaxID=9 RepID=A0A7U3YAB9_BUCA5|nr:UDP-N-acetylmuramoyl-tripeptide--D-alanyl-D-alanine ligase [Buchnera aphidicola]ACL30589.1 UDP-N-acetylmuramoylalanyl-D-glutamyl-2, 6-diaminopimelate-D-alanyl-D-alanyl ligase [Buchnera aphidicola str. 5A (Acyrthosiphon pisum)]ADP66617.1 UDP-N-acetylmuramoylalanyl-D-glutamyl-2, 6-diaminopimelate-D-alanyl-D-alanyl ligase [Buchnera aphidicola str. TLW03 (Acyrthosiphon pisum)]OQX99837.1 MAG: UDP-N-acetylmuramoyl-tripeptide--D-alanyl-D-alanine ligase [Erwiniaceae bacterium 4572_131]
MISLSLKKIALITNGTLYGADLLINEIVIDTKKIIPGCLFIALIGRKFDAHIFIHDALKKKCAAFVTQKNIKPHVPYIIVENTSIALGQIAGWVRKKTKAKILAITGSCGKTSVKEMTASILRKNGNTISTIDNLNNNIGVPMTLLQLKQEHKYGVIELGASKPGEIAYTSNISQPDIILINNIHCAHLQGFKSLLGVSKAKSEIFSGLKPNSTVIINLDSHHFSQWKKDIKNSNILFFSIKKKKYSNFFCSNIKIHIHGTSFTMHTPCGKINISLPFLGYQNISNALAASAFSFALKIPLKKIKIGLLDTPIVSKRLESIILEPNKILIDDTYNSNVSSMISAIKVLERMPGYKILVTGDMAELGENSMMYHQMIGNTANSSAINKIFSIGDMSSEITKIFNNGKHFLNKKKLSEYLKNVFLKKKKITILVKGSRSTKMEKVVEDLIKESKKNANFF